MQQLSIGLLAVFVVRAAFPVNACAEQYWAEALPGKGGDAVAVAINEKGDVVGRVCEGLDCEAAVWIDGQMHLLGSLGNDDTEACDINNHGWIVGRAFHNYLRALYWHIDKEGKVIESGELPGDSAQAMSVNDALTVVGQHAGAVACSWRYDGQWRQTILPDGFMALGVDETGRFCGMDFNFRPIVWKRGEPRWLSLDPLESPRSGVAYDLHANGLVVGLVEYEIDEETYDRAAVWGSDMQTLLHVGDFPNWYFFEWDPKIGRRGAFAVNAGGTIVGRRDFVIHGGKSAFVCYGQESLKLERLVINEETWQLTAAYDVNDAGVIVAYGRPQHGDFGSVLLTPVGE